MKFVKNAHMFHYLFSALFFIHFFLFLSRSAVLAPSFSISTFAVILTSLLSINILWFFLSSFFVYRKKISFAVGTLFYLIYNLLSSYKYEARIDFDYSLMAVNIFESFYVDSLLIVLKSINFKVFMYGMIPYLFLIVIILMGKPSADCSFQNSAKRFFKSSASLVVYLFCLIFFPIDYDNLSQFLRSIYYHHSDRHVNYYIKSLNNEEFPFMKENNIPFLQNRDEDKIKDSPPNVIILAIESFSGLHINNINTPFFYEKIKEGFYVRNFYGNSIQTCKGHFSILFSLIPSFKQKVFTTYSRNNFKSIASILKNNGYNTFFLMAHKEVDFDNTSVFLKKNGFDHVDSAYFLLNRKEIDEIWGWGMEDEVFYKKMFEYIDIKNKKENTPFFLFAATIMNHMKFDQIPKEKRTLFPDPESFEENYLNSIYLTDSHLKIFFDELEKRGLLKNTLVIITGDHGFPTGQHGYVNNEASFYEEFFRVPLLVLWPDKVQPDYNDESVFSHIDIAPTILELLNISPDRHHFLGKSVISSKNKGNTAYLVNPYNGGYVGVVKENLKYILNLRADMEYVFDLRKDFFEKDNIINNIDNDVLNDLRESSKMIFINQYLIEKNRVWK